MDPTPKPSFPKWLWITLIIVAVLAAGFFAYWFLMGPGKKTETKTTTTTTPTATTPTETTSEEEDTTEASDEWLTYTNTAYGYSIQYPPTLTYVEQNGTKDMYFQSAEDEAALAECASRPETDCPGSSQINISVDVNSGTTNDESGKNLQEVVSARQAGLLSADTITTTLGGQDAYAGMMSGLSSYYDLITVYNDHTYDLTINCNAENFETCSEEITEDQQRMIDSFAFL